MSHPTQCRSIRRQTVAVSISQNELSDLVLAMILINNDDNASLTPKIDKILFQIIVLNIHLLDPVLRYILR